MRPSLLDWSALAVVAILSCTPVRAASPPESVPNFVFILVDDMRWDELGCTGHPFVRTPAIDQLAHEGGLFENAFVTTPLCSPSRGSFLTGQYAHAHGIIDNTGRGEQSRRLVTWPRLLHEAGTHETAFVGKWHMGNDHEPRPGFDHWVCLKGQGRALDPELNIDGDLQIVEGYVTDLLTEQALAFLDRERDRPFCLYFAHKAMHPESIQADDGTVTRPAVRGYIPAERHRDWYLDEPLPRRENYGAPPRGKPALERQIGQLPALGPETVTRDSAIRGRLRMLAAVDESVGRIRRRLEQSGLLDQTLIIVTSDQGHFYGEHGLGTERRLAYEESIRIPLIVRYPPVIRPGARYDPLVLNLDIAPTCLELAGIEIPGHIQGQSLLPVFRGQSESFREAFLIEYYSDIVYPRIRNMGYRAVRTSRYKLIRFAELDGMDELYDLEHDPYEVANRIDDPEYRPVIEELDQLIRQLAGRSLGAGSDDQK